MSADWWKARKSRVSRTLWKHESFSRELRGCNGNFKSQKYKIAAFVQKYI